MVDDCAKVRWVESLDGEGGGDGLGVTGEFGGGIIPLPGLLNALLGSVSGGGVMIWYNILRSLA